MKFHRCIIIFVFSIVWIGVRGEKSGAEPSYTWVWDDNFSDHENRPPPAPLPVARPSTTVPSTTPTSSPVTVDIPGTPLPCPGCPLTPEYNPVCGTDGITYNNPSVLKCSQMCGAVVSTQFYGACRPLQKIDNSTL